MIKQTYNIDDYNVEQINVLPYCIAGNTNYLMRLKYILDSSPVGDGYVYIVICDEFDGFNGFVKIGRTNNLKKRIAMIRSYTPFEIDTVIFFKTNEPAILESKMHKLFAQFRIDRREWFQMPLEVIYILYIASGIFDFSRNIMPFSNLLFTSAWDNLIEFRDVDSNVLFVRTPDVVQLICRNDLHRFVTCLDVLPSEESVKVFLSECLHKGFISMFGDTNKHKMFVSPYINDKSISSLSTIPSIFNLCALFNKNIQHYISIKELKLQDYDLMKIKGWKGIVVDNCNVYREDASDDL